MTNSLKVLHGQIRQCRICRDAPTGARLPHEPRPVLQVSSKARLLICGQAPGTKVHASGRPFTDRSGDRLRSWLGVTDAQFYDENLMAIVPMGFCFPGQDKRGGDLPPRVECRQTWHDQLMPHLSGVEVMFVIGRYAMDYHLQLHGKPSLTNVVADYQTYLDKHDVPLKLPLPHPSWRNTAWLKKHSWFEADYLPQVQSLVKNIIRKVH